MKFKRIIAALAASTLALTIAACGDGEATVTEDNTDTETAPDTADTPVSEEAYVIDGVTVYDPSIDYIGVTLSDGLDENGYIAGVKALDHVKLPKYVGIDIDSSAMTVTEDELNAELWDTARIFSDKATEVEPRAAKRGDLLRVSYTSTIDGKTFAGGDNDEEYFTVGGYFLADGLSDSFVGLKPGDVLEADYTTPEDFANYEFAGKEAQAVITVDAVLEPDYDAIAVASGFDTVDELIEDIEDYLLSGKRFAIFTELVSAGECESVPAEAIKYMISVDLVDYAFYAYGYGVSFDEFLQTYVGYDSVKAMIDDRLEDYRDGASAYLIAQAMAEEQGIVVTDEMFDEYGYGPEMIESSGKPYIKQFLLFQEILPAFIIENAI